MNATATPERTTVIAACALALFANGLTTLSPDLGWILEYGQRVLTSHQIVWHNVESFTEPDHANVRPEWLFDVTLAALHQWGGAPALIIFKWLLLGACVVALAFAVAASTPHRLARLITTLAAVGASWLAYEYLRAQLITFIALGWVVAAGFSRNRRALWACVPLCWLWANLHNGFPLGLVTLAALLAAGNVELGAPRTIWFEHGLVVLASALVTLLNPFGSEPWFTAFSLSAGAPLVREWVPLWQLSSLTLSEEVTFAALVALAVGAPLFVPARQLRRWALILVGLGLCLTATRHTRLAPILLAPAVAYVLERALRDRDARLQWLLPAVAAVVTTGAVVTLASNLDLALSFQEPPVASPATAITVMLANDLQGDVWNDYDFGGTLLFAAPKNRVAVDGRYLHAYSYALLQRAITLGRSQLDPLQVVRASGASLVLLARNDPALSSLRLGYTPLFCDDQVCLLSNDPEHLRKLDAGLLVPERPVEQRELFQSKEGAQWVVNHRSFVRQLLR